MEKNLYPATLKGLPDEMGKLEKIIGSAAIKGMTSKIDEISNRFEKDDWVLFDKDPPLEKAWVLG